MTIPQGDPSCLHSVSERRKVTFASEGAAQTSDSKTEGPVVKSSPDPSLDSSAPVKSQKEGEAGEEETKADALSHGQRKSSIEVKDSGKEKGEEKKIVVTEASLSLRHDTEDKISIEEQFVRNEPESAPRELRVSSLPLLELPKCSNLASFSSYSSNNRKLSLNLPYSYRPAQPKKSAPPPPPPSQTSSSSSSSSASRKFRRKSLPQRTGQRYQKIPQDDFSPSDASPSNPGNLNLACATSPTFNTPPSPPASLNRNRNRPNLSVHNAEVHASFHKDSDAVSPNFGRNLESFVRIHSALDADGNKGRKKKQNTLLPDSCKKSTKKLNLSRAVSLSSKSLDDLTAFSTGRGQPDPKKRSKKPGRSVSSEDLAGLRIHRAGRHAADPHPSPGSPSHCCLVSVSRVPMAAATSHLTLDSEYQTVRLAVLGAPGVGKSAIVKQFVMQQFLEEYVPTEQRQVFCPAVIINEHLYEVRIIDCPYIPYFPVNSLYEWTDFRGYGLRNATAYVLVYDITSEESFEYIKSLRLQILESRNRHDVPIFVVGNKHDLAEERGVSRREVANLVKKQWKCGYIECSAKYNWHIMLLFKELMKTIDYIDYGHKPTSMRVQDALRRNRCLIL